MSEDLSCTRYLTWFLVFEPDDDSDDENGERTLPIAKIPDFIDHIFKILEESSQEPQVQIWQDLRNSSEQLEKLLKPVNEILQRNPAELNLEINGEHLDNVLSTCEKIQETITKLQAPMDAEIEAEKAEKEDKFGDLIDTQPHTNKLFELTFNLPPPTVSYV